MATASGFAASRLGLAVEGLGAVDWLCLTGQSILEVTGGPVFTDRPGEITALRRALTWYPDPVWRYVVAADWIRIGEDLPLLGRTGRRGDEQGSRVIGARVVRTVTHLAFLLARSWPPYPKWTGTMFTRLPVAADLKPELDAVLAARYWPEREAAIGRTVAVLERAQWDAGLPVPETGVLESFTDRPSLGVRGETIDLLDPPPDLPPGVGSLEQWNDNVRVLKDPVRRVRTARALYGADR